MYIWFPLSNGQGSRLPVATPRRNHELDLPHLPARGHCIDVRDLEGSITVRDLRDSENSRRGEVDVQLPMFASVSSLQVPDRPPT